MEDAGINPITKVGDRIVITNVPGAISNVKVSMSGVVISEPRKVDDFFEVEIKLSDGQVIVWKEVNLKVIGLEQLTEIERTEIPDEVEDLNLDLIRLDGGTQPRAKINKNHVKLLIEQISEGVKLDPIVVFYDGENYWLADGFHRTEAHKSKGKKTISAKIKQGTRRDAVLYSVGANAEHKAVLARSREDKRRAAMKLLEDPDWQKWSDREIARQCKVSRTFVGNLRKKLTVNVDSESKEKKLNKTINSDDEDKNVTVNVDSENISKELPTEEKKRTYKTKHGTIAQMDVSNISKIENADSLEPKSDRDIKEAKSDDRESRSNTKAGSEVNPNLVLNSFVNNLEYLGTEQIKVATRAIAKKKFEAIKDAAIGLATTEAEAIEIVKAIASKFPNVIREAID